MSFRVQELEIEDNKIKAVFSRQGVVREKYVGELGEGSIKYLCKNLRDSAFFDLPSDFEDDEIEVTGNRAIISLQITINGKYHSVFAADPSPKKELAVLDTIWLIAFSKAWNDHMRVKAYTSKGLFRQQSE